MASLLVIYGHMKKTRSWLKRVSILFSLRILEASFCVSYYRIIAIFPRSASWTISQPASSTKTENLL